MASLQQRELDLMDYRFGERKKDGCADPHNQQLLDFSEPDCPSCEFIVTTWVIAERQGWSLLERLTAEMGSARLTTSYSLHCRKGDRWLPCWVAHSPSLKTCLLADHLVVGVWTADR